MNALQRYWQSLKRTFTLGPAIVDQSMMTWGSSGEFQPPEYIEYLATSNGVYACANLRANLLADLPIKLFTLKANGDKRDVTSGDLVRLLTKPNPYWTGNRLKQMTELSLCMWGECFWFVARGSRSGIPQELWWARADRVKVVPHPTKYLSGFLYEPTNGGTPIPFTPEETVWFRFPNPMNEYEGLSPLAAARIAADTSRAAMQSNFNFFRNGLNAGGIITNAGGTPFTQEQAEELEGQLNRRLKGVDKAHRWGVLRFDAKFQAMAMSPKDSEYLGGLKWNLEDICRAYSVPQDLIGGQRTFENVDAAMKMIYTQAILPEARFIADELTAQLLPMFGGQADLAEFDISGVNVLQEDKQIEWQIVSDQITKGALLVNEWRDNQGLDPVPWGDAWWAPFTLAPIRTGTAPDLPEPDAPDALPAGEGETPAEPMPPRRLTRAVAFGSPEHERLWRLFARRAEPHERKVAAVTTELLQRQRTAVLARLNGRTARNAAEVHEDPFDKNSWIKKFRVAMRPVLRLIVQDSGQAALDDLALSTAFDLSDPNVIRFLEGRAQRFAREVNETTWTQLKASLGEGISAGESIDTLSARVETVMEGRIQSASTTIARTETVTASNGGTLLSWEQSGVVQSKTWLSALDDRTRDDHIEAHGQTVGLDEDFDVGGDSGPAPGQMGSAENDINCRCSMVAGIEPLPERLATTNGHSTVDVLSLQRIAEALR